MKTNYTIRKHLFRFGQLTLIVLIILLTAFFKGMFALHGVPLLIYIMLAFYALAAVITIVTLKDEYRRFKRKLRK